MSTPFQLLCENDIFNNYQFFTPNHSEIFSTGTVYTECVYTVPVATGERYFRGLSVFTPNHSLRVTGTVYTESCTPFLLLQENHILNNYRFFTPRHSHIVTGNGVNRRCVHRSRCYMKAIFSIIIGFQLQIIVIQ